MHLPQAFFKILNIIKRHWTILLLMFFVSFTILYYQIINKDLFALQVGQSWTMRNAATGALTKFEVLSVGNNWGCESGELFDLRITKDSADTYWGPGLAEADLHFILKKEGMRYRSIGWWATPNLVTVQYHPIEGREIPYVIFDNIIGRADTAYRRHVSLGEVVSKCNPVLDGYNYSWVTEFKPDFIITDIYTGPVIRGHYEEGNSSKPSEQVEDWYFAPNIGVVKIVDYRQGFKDFSPPLVLERVSTNE